MAAVELSFLCLKCLIQRFNPLTHPPHPIPLHHAQTRVRPSLDDVCVHYGCPHDVCVHCYHACRARTHHTQQAQIISQGAEEERAESARLSSFVGTIAIGDLVKSTLGPRGMDKILQLFSRPQGHDGDK